jgi:hypothetical protein
MAGRRVDDEATLRTMADLIIRGLIDSPKRGKSEGITRAVRAIKPQATGADIERLRKAYRARRFDLDTAAVFRWRIHDEQSGCEQSASELYCKHDKEVARERAEALDYLVNDIFDGDHIRLIQALSSAASSGDRDEKMDELAEHLEELAKAIRLMQTRWGSP